MIDLHYWPTPNGRKIVIALEEMGLAYAVLPVNIGAGDQFKPEFLAISPNNRMPAIVDHDGPGGEPVSVFESGAILQYLGRKTGMFYPAEERARIDVEQWLYWQMAGLGPMGGQAHHFRGYAPGFIKDQRQLAYGAARYTNETHRLYGVLDKRLRGRDFICGDYSIADMACWPWTVSWKLQGIVLDEFPALKAWSKRMSARPAVKKALETTAAGAGAPQTDQTREVLFGQRARP